MWDRDLFDWAVMIEWNEQPTIHKAYTNTGTYFTKQLAAIESFEGAGGRVSKKQGYIQTRQLSSKQRVLLR